MPKAKAAPEASEAAPDLLGKNIKAEFDRESLRDAVKLVTPAIPARSPKPVIQNLLLVADPEHGATIEGTNLEVGIRVKVAGAKLDAPIRTLLSPHRLSQILGLAQDVTIAMTFSDRSTTIKGKGWKHELSTEDPETFPSVPEFERTSYHEIGAAMLRRTIRRVSFASDDSATRYALAGALLELGPETLSLVGTDGRRLACDVVPARSVEGGTSSAGTVVIPTRALNLISSLIEGDEQPTLLMVQRRERVGKEGVTNDVPDAVLIQGESGMLYTRLVEGRYPDYRQIFPKDLTGRAELPAQDLERATDLALIPTEKENRGVDYAFNADGSITLSNETADVGTSRIVLPNCYAGPETILRFDARYIAEMLRRLDPETPITLQIRGAGTAMLISTPDGYRYVVMPISRD